MSGLRSKSKSGSHSGESEFVQTVLGSQPQFVNHNAAVQELNTKLNQLAEKHGMAVAPFLKKAEASTEFNEDFVSALQLSRQITRFQ